VKFRWAGVFYQAQLEAPRGVRILLQHAADLWVDLLAIEALLGAGDASRQARAR